MNKVINVKLLLNKIVEADLVLGKTRSGLLKRSKYYGCYIRAEKRHASK
ncbi:hypothetical protein ES706_06512 [subsurface metagenome]